MNEITAAGPTLMKMNDKIRYGFKVRNNQKLKKKKIERYIGLKQIKKN